MVCRHIVLSVLQRRICTTECYPEVVLNNFTTRLGHTIARMLAVLFPHDPQFRARRVVTFHNQRDYIFFRQHRYPVLCVICVLVQKSSV